MRGQKVRSDLIFTFNMVFKNLNYNKLLCLLCMGKKGISPEDYLLHSGEKPDLATLSLTSNL